MKLDGIFFLKKFNLIIMICYLVRFFMSLSALLMSLIF